MYTAAPDAIPTPHPPLSTLIVGLGKTGLACARFLNRQGVAITVTDTRSTPPGLEAMRRELPDVPLALGGFSPEVFATVERIIISPGVSIAEPLIQQALARSVPVLGDIELFAQTLHAWPEHQRGKVLAVTGSNGKSTVVSLLGVMAQAAGWRVAVGGNLGEPALNLLDPTCQLYILELSSFQLETTYTLAPTAAVVLNISPDHLDRYPNLAAYIQAKARIYHGSMVGVFNLDDPQVSTMPGRGERSIGFTLGSPPPDGYGLMEYAGESWLCQGIQPLLPVTALQLQGRHNVANAIAALALGSSAGLPIAAMLTALKHYSGLPHRAQLITTLAGVSWYNDSKGTNPGATIAALEGLHPLQGSGLAVLIAGGDAKDADFTALAPVVARTCRAVILIGRDAPLLEQALLGHTAVTRAMDLAQAVQQAAQLAKPGDHVLLSPACASFDMFRNYEHRGEVFTDLVRELVL